MKRKAILSALFSAIVACFFVACSNDSDALDINAGTRSVTSSPYMTREEVQARLDEIGDRYGIKTYIEENANIDFVTEKVFADFEKSYSEKMANNKKNIGYIDDTTIDNISLMAAPPTGEMYTGSFSRSIIYKCKNPLGIRDDVSTTFSVTWTVGENNFNNSLHLHAKIDVGHGNRITISPSAVSGSASSPSFNYSGTIECNFAVLKDTIEYIYSPNGEIIDSIYNNCIDTHSDTHKYAGAYNK